MESLKLAELIAAAFELNKSLLQLKSAQTNCTIAELKLHLTQELGQLAITQHQQAQLTLSSARSRSIFNPTNNTNGIQE